MEAEIFEKISNSVLRMIFFFKLEYKDVFDVNL